MPEKISASAQRYPLIFRKRHIRRLVPLSKLELLVCGTGIEHLDALLDLPALKRIKIMDDRIYDEVRTEGHPPRRVFDTLKAKGVSVSVHWISWSGEEGQKPPPTFK